MASIRKSSASPAVIGMNPVEPVNTNDLSVRPTGTLNRRPSESDTVVPLRNLNSVDVGALIFNKMVKPLISSRWQDVTKLAKVGTGIFTTPGAVLLSTKSKGLSIGLWFVGGIYSLICLVIYLEYAIALPFNGGELIYLNEIYYVPDMLVTILYAGVFIAMANTAGNAFAFAKFTLIAAQRIGNEPTATEADMDAKLSPALVRFVAISIVTAICFLHFTWSRLGLFLNKAFALYKIALCLAIFIAGVAAWNKPNSGVSGPENFGEVHGGGINGLAALITIFYAYEGWENATYVSGNAFFMVSPAKRPLTKSFRLLARFTRFDGFLEGRPTVRHYDWVQWSQLV
ncbi:MAG: hypothetical protein M1822_004691 [Bathelium mastoideum]|nr:MAG: hypothetical protein M1822_004691 [Bathelium mastoideum]